MPEFMHGFATDNAFSSANPVRLMFKNVFSN